MQIYKYNDTKLHGYEGQTSPATSSTSSNFFGNLRIAEKCWYI